MEEIKSPTKRKRFSSNEIVFTKNKDDFGRVKRLLNGCVFWRAIEGNKVEIKIISNSVIDLVKSLKD